jgi:beta-lactamase superfamily II metal-dependent hydrolase
MAQTFRIDLLPARHGDCIWVVYGEPGHEHHVLIDGGPLASYPRLRARFEALEPGQRHVELLVITHVDGDHIEGAIKLLNAHDLGVRYGDIWFNGWPQLERAIVDTPAQEMIADCRGPKYGEYLQIRLQAGHYAWNRWFDGRAAFVPETGRLPAIRLEGGLVLTLLSPTARKLHTLRNVWSKALDELGVASGADELKHKLEADTKFRGSSRSRAVLAEIRDAALVATKLDAAVANGSSIAFLAEFGGRRCAFLADAHAQIVQKSLARLARERGEDRLRLDALKLSHHGSAGNLTEQLLKTIDCRNYFVSTDGTLFGHPDEQAIALILENHPSARLYFNYPRTRSWPNTALQERVAGSAVFPENSETGLQFDVLAAEPRVSAHP